MDDIIVSQGTSGSFIIVPTITNPADSNLTSGRVFPRASATAGVVTATTIVNPADNLLYYKYTYPGGSALIPEFPAWTWNSAKIDHINSWLTIPVLFPIYNAQGGDASDKVVKGTSGIGKDEYWITTPGVYYFLTTPNGGILTPIIIDNDECPRTGRLMMCVTAVAEPPNPVITFYGPWSINEVVSKYLPLTLAESTPGHWENGYDYLQSGATVWAGNIAGESVQAPMAQLSGAVYTQPPHNNWGAYVVTGDNVYVVSGTRWFHTCGVFSSGAVNTVLYDESNTNTPTLLYQVQDGGWRLYSAGSGYSVDSSAVQRVTCAAIPYYPLAGMPHLPFILNGAPAADITVTDGPYSNFVDETANGVVIGYGSGASYINQRWSFTPRTFDDAHPSGNPYRFASVSYSGIFSSATSTEHLYSSRFAMSSYTSVHHSGDITYRITGGTVTYDGKVEEGTTLVYINQIDGGTVTSDRTYTARIGSGGGIGSWTSGSTIVSSGGVFRANGNFGPGWYVTQEGYQATDDYDIPVSDEGYRYYYSWVVGASYADWYEQWYVINAGWYPEPPAVEDTSPWRRAPETQCSGGALKYNAGNDGWVGLPIGKTTVNYDSTYTYTWEVDDPQGADDPNPMKTVNTTVISGVIYKFVGVKTSGAIIRQGNVPENPPDFTASVDSGGTVNVQVSWRGITSRATGQTGEINIFTDTASFDGNTCSDGVFTAKSCTVSWSITTAQSTGWNEIHNSSAFGSEFISGARTSLGSTPNSFFDFRYSQGGNQLLTLEKYSPNFPTLFSGYSAARVFTLTGTAKVTAFSDTTRFYRSDYASSNYYDKATKDGDNLSTEEVNARLTTTTEINPGSILNADCVVSNGADHYTGNTVTGRKEHKDGGPAATPCGVALCTQPVNANTELVQGSAEIYIGGSVHISGATLKTVYSAIPVDSKTVNGQVQYDESKAASTTYNAYNGSMLNGPFNAGTELYAAPLYKPVTIDGHSYSRTHLRSEELPVTSSFLDEVEYQFRAVSGANHGESSAAADSGGSVLYDQAVVMSGYRGSRLHSGGYWSLAVSAAFSSGGVVVYASEMHSEQVPLTDTARIATLIASGAVIYNRGTELLNRIDSTIWTEGCNSLTAKIKPMDTVGINRSNWGVASCNITTTSSYAKWTGSIVFGASGGQI